MPENRNSVRKIADLLENHGVMPVCLKENDTLQHVLEKHQFLRETMYVVKSSGQLKGKFPVSSLIEYFVPYEQTVGATGLPRVSRKIFGLPVRAFAPQPVVVLSSGMCVADALSLMLLNEVEEAPVLSPDGAIVKVLRFIDIVSDYLEFTRGDDEGDIESSVTQAEGRRSSNARESKVV